MPGSTQGPTSIGSTQPRLHEAPVFHHHGAARTSLWIYGLPPTRHGVADPEAKRGNPPSRGAAHQRKKAATRNAKRGRPLIESPEPEVQVGEKAAVDLALAVTEELQEYAADIKSAKRALHDEVSREFRGVVGVPGNPWPDLTIERSNEITGEVYMNPLFEATVQHPQNHRLFLEFIRQVESQMIKNSESMPSSLKHEKLNFTWDRDLLYEMTKTSFRSCKGSWRKQTDAAAAERDHANQQVNRRRERRVAKTKRLEKAVALYAAKRRVPAQAIKDVFVHEQYMSDEASGPEDNSETSTARGYENANDKRFLEVLACDWRSNEMSDGLHEMQNIAFDLLTPTQKIIIQYERVRGTGRQSLRVPDRAPYNFGINMAWFDKYKDHPDYSALLEDWGNYPDPEGFGASLVTGEDAAAGNADEAHNVEGLMAEED
ncbi:hypothetical protein B0H13DRAFT_2266897 [Mycena leptocephala]|nr:hypothetical protein B0H13DRAFT_2266897 [Mycena leptocephala]